MGQTGKKPLGLYVHVPFCVQKCAYCDFLSAPSTEKVREEYVQALGREMEEYRRLFETDGLGEEYETTTVFFGGGTPSVLEGSQVRELMDRIKGCFPFPAAEESLRRVEATLEANPGTLTGDKLESYRQAGISRLSIGLQSADNRELALLGRIHTYEEFLENYRLAREKGFDNINVDLMSALPGQTAADFRETLERVVRLRPEHISAYSLMIEEGTPFYQKYGEGRQKDSLPSEEEDRAIYGLTKDFLGRAGYSRYEISNYAQPGFEGRHNCAYWKRTDYLGLGLGASSFFQGKRYQNIGQLEVYLKSPFVHRNVQVITKEDAMEETMYLGLRMAEGVSAEKFRRQFGLEIKEVYKNVISRQLELGVVCEMQDRIRLTDYGIDVSNTVLAEYLF